MSGGIIENTVKFRFPVSAPRPTWAEIAAFLKKLEPNVMHMETVYKMGDDRSLCIKYMSTDAMKQALQRNVDIVKFQYSNGKSIDVRMLPAGGNIRYVRVFDVPPEISDEDLSLALGKYGKIERMIREKFPSDLGLDHMFTGVRGLYMEVEKEIPPTVEILHWKGKIFYEELRNKCFLCQSVGHQRSNCPQRAVRTQRENEKREVNLPRTYAGVVIEAVTGTEEQESVEILEEEVIEEVDNEAVDIVPVGSQETSEVAEPVYRSEYERNLAENWAKFEEEKRRRQEEYRKNEKSMQRRYKESLEAREREQRDHWEKCEAERKSRQEKYKRDLSRQRQAQLEKEQAQSPPKKSIRKQ